MSRQAMRAAMAVAAVLAAVPAQAQTGEAVTGAGNLAQDQPSPLAEPRAFDIPAQPLVTALNAFGRQSGLQISIDAAQAAGINVPGVSGTMRPDQALNLLLAGTGFVARFTGPRAMMLTRPQSGGPSGAMQLDPVQVQGVFPVPQQAMIDNLPPPYAGGQVATGGQLGLLGNRPVMDTPFNQTNYTAQKAQDQQAKTVKDVLADGPSIRPQRGDGGLGDDNVSIRGFQVSNTATAYGGLYGMLPTASISPELAERVEVLKGASAMLNGMTPNGGFIGGIVNVVPKRAPDADLTQVTAGYVSAGQFGGHADLARRFGEDKEFGVRFNGVFRAGQTDVEWNSDKRALAVLGLDFRGRRVRLSADLGYQYQYVGGAIPFLSLGPGVNLPWAPYATTNQGQPWGFVDRKDLFGVMRAEADITERVTAYATFGAHDNRAAIFSPAVIQIANFNGAATATGPTNSSAYNTYLSGEAGIRGFVDTGPIAHEFSLVGTIFQQYNGVGAVTGTASATNLYDPTVTARPSLPTPAANLTATTGLSSFGFADTLSAADKRVQLTVGGRLQQVQTANFNPTSGAKTATYDQSALSPSVALVVKPFWENVSFYANWIQGLQQGTTVGQNFANAGEVFPPFKSTQYEAGVKIDWGRLTTTASVFQISQPSVISNVATNSLALGGEQINQGLELNIFGEVTKGLRVLGGAMFLNAVLAQTQGGLTDGWIAPFSPGAQFNLAGEWDLPMVEGLTVTGRVTYTGTQYLDTTYPRRFLPEWSRFDVGARYAFDNPAAKGRPLVARFNVDNVLGASYWAGGNSASTLFIGAPRTFRLSLTADF